ncbi:6-phosphofructokinase [Candidatus Aerophobetes bacterium]|nr:6-phosphofructokinase [Candidatus Aerophobetes bacterium]
MAKTLVVLTGGGHAAGLNSGIAGILEKAKQTGWKVYGALDGWKGVVEEMFVNLTEFEPMSFVNKGGSILGSSRVRPEAEKVKEVMEKNKIDALIAMGGEDTLGALWEVYSEYKIPCVGWPKTMDNDLSETYFTIGYPTAVKIASKEVANSFDTACTHERIAVVVVFGRHTDWVAAGAGALGSADLVIPAERPYTLEEICRKASSIFEERKKTYGKGFAVMVVAEGASISGLESHVRQQEKELDQYGHVKLDPNLLASYLSGAIKDMTKKMFGKPIGTAPIVLTYQLRNGSPCWVDMEMGYKLGEKCVKMLEEQEVGAASVIKKENGSLSVSSASLEKVVKVRKMEKEGLFDYENLVPNDNFLKYAEPFLGKPLERAINMVERKTLLS